MRRTTLVILAVLGLALTRGATFAHACDACSDLQSNWQDAMDTADSWIAQYSSDQNGLAACTDNACTISYQTWLADDSDQIGFWTGVQVSYIRGARTLHCPWAM